MDYSLRELECFCAVAEELSFTRAAAKLRLAQPPLSRHVRTLEEKLGANLFDRAARRVSLTAVGALFYEETFRILPQLRRAGETTRRFAAGQTQCLRLGFVSAVLGEELTQTLRRYREHNTTVQLMVQDGLPAELLDFVAQGRLDGAFVGLRPRHSSPGITFHPWHEEPLAAFIPLGHPLAERREIALSELAQESLVAVAHEAAPAFAAFVTTACIAAGFRPRVAAESSRAQAVAVMVAAGSGIALLPHSLARIVGTSAAVVALKKAPRITHVFARRAQGASATITHFIKSLGTPKRERRASS